MISLFNYNQVESTRDTRLAYLLIVYRIYYVLSNYIAVTPHNYIDNY